MSHDTKIGIVTAAGYTEAERYYGRLHGLLEAVKASTVLTSAQKQNLIVMGKHSPSFNHYKSTPKKGKLTHLQAANLTSSSPTTPAPPSYSPTSHAANGSSPACPPGHNQPSLNSSMWRNPLCASASPTSPSPLQSCAKNAL